MGAGETAIESLLSTNPDPDHVTHAHNGEGPTAGADADNSPAPSIDSDKENNVEMVNLLHHPKTPGGAATPTPGGAKQQRDDAFIDIVDEEVQQSEQPGLGVDQKPSAQVRQKPQHPSLWGRRSEWLVVCAGYKSKKHTYTKAAEAQGVYCVACEPIKPCLVLAFTPLLPCSAQTACTQGLIKCVSLQPHKQRRPLFPFPNQAQGGSGPYVGPYTTALM